MSPVTNERVLFRKIPTGAPVPGEHLAVDKSEQIDLDASLAEGEILVKTLVLSLDPYLRGKMRAQGTKSYSPAFDIDQPIRNFGVVEVLKSTQHKYPAGTKLYGIFAFKQYDVIKDADIETLGTSGAWRVIDNKEGLPWSAWVGAAGMPGKTAYYGFKALSHSKKGEKVFVTSAYGPVGQMVIQVAKAAGCEVIASAGTDEKVAYLRELGADAAFNYKTSDTLTELQKFGPIAVLWDGVGGSTLDAWFAAADRGGRAIECGMISAYNGGEPYGFKNIMQIIGKGLNVRGFLVSEFEDELVDEFYATVPKGLADGTFKSAEEVKDGLATTPQAFTDMLSGLNKGKVVIKVADASA